MKKYIDADRLRAEIGRFSSTEYNGNTLGDDVANGALDYVLELIDSLRQEQPEVDLDFQSFAKEMDSIFALPKDMTGNTEENPLNWEYAIARHFYELGRNARK